MKATELRLGNLFANIEDDSIYKVTKINEDTIEGICINNMGWFGEKHFHLIEQVLPIEITEEWLLKFGFKYREFLNDFFIKLDDHNILIAEKEVIGFAIYKCEENQRKYFLTKRYYAHQLQNLFHSMTGEELTQVSEGEK